MEPRPDHHYETIPSIANESQLLPKTFEAISTALQRHIDTGPCSPVYAEENVDEAEIIGQAVSLSRRQPIVVPESISAVLYNERGIEAVNSLASLKHPASAQAISHIRYDKKDDALQINGSFWLLSSQEIQIDFNFIKEQRQTFLSPETEKEFKSFAFDLGLRPLWLIARATTANQKKSWRPRTYMNEVMGRELLRFLQ